VACVNYFHIYWIPLFGWKSPVYFCSLCQRALLPQRQYSGDIVVGVPLEAETAYQMLAPEVGIPWYYFSGLILVACAVAYAALF
jgi:hypothetical protein